MTPATCGNASKSANEAPPLKSIRTKLSVCGSCVMERETTSVRSNSLLPEPVAPMIRPCGPMPLSAASLKSMKSGSPSARMPIGTLSNAWRERGSQVCAASTFEASGIPIKFRRGTSCERSCCAPASTSNKGDMLRAMFSHILGSIASGVTPSRRAPPRLTCSKFTMPMALSDRRAWTWAGS